MKYQIQIKKEALKELKQLPAKAVGDITSAIDHLAEEPRPVGCKKLKGALSEYWRIRIGNYRVVYLIEDVIRIVSVIHIGHRKDIYE